MDEHRNEISLTERQMVVLQAIVDEYLRHNRPVGLRLISRKYIPLSPASIRNTMADLEEEGYVYQPHTSAGRVPTLKGLRFFINHLMKREQLTPEALEKILSSFSRASSGAIDELLRSTLQVLSQVTTYIGIGAPPNIQRYVIKELGILKLSRRRLLVIVVMYPGYLKRNIVQMDHEVTSEEIRCIGNYLRELVVGYTVEEAKKRLQKELEEERNAFNNLLKYALGLGFEIIESCREDEIYVEGTTRLVVYSHLLKGRLDKILAAMEKRMVLLSVLQVALEEQKDTVVIFGEDTGCEELKGVGIVLSRFDSRDTGAGFVGVVGPAYMNYPRVLPIVEVTAKAMSGTLGELAMEMEGGYGR